MKKNWKVIVAALVVIVVAAAMLCVYHFNRPATQTGAKTIVVEVIHKDGARNEFTYHTDAEYLADVLVEDGLIVGEEGEYGLYIQEVDGEVADFSVDGGWWCLSKDGEMTVTSVSQTPIADGDHFEWTYTIG